MMIKPFLKSDCEKPNVDTKNVRAKNVKKLLALSFKRQAGCAFECVVCCSFTGQRWKNCSIRVFASIDNSSQLNKAFTIERNIKLQASSYKKGVRLNVLRVVGEGVVWKLKFFEVFEYWTPSKKHRTPMCLESDKLQGSSCKLGVCSNVLGVV